MNVLSTKAIGWNIRNLKPYAIIETRREVYKVTVCCTFFGWHVFTDRLHGKLWVPVLQHGWEQVVSSEGEARAAASEICIAIERDMET